MAPDFKIHAITEPSSVNSLATTSRLFSQTQLVSVSAGLSASPTGVYGTRGYVVRIRNFRLLVRSPYSIIKTEPIAISTTLKECKCDAEILCGYHCCVRR